MSKPAFVGSETSRFTTVQLKFQDAASDFLRGYAELLVVYNPPTNYPGVLLVTKAVPFRTKVWVFSSQEEALAAWCDGRFEAHKLSKQPGCIDHYQVERLTMEPWFYAMEGEEIAPGSKCVDRLSVETLIAAYKSKVEFWNGWSSPTWWTAELVAGLFLSEYHTVAAAIEPMRHDLEEALVYMLGPYDNVVQVQDVIDLLEQIPQEVPAQ